VRVGLFQCRICDKILETKSNSFHDKVLLMHMKGHEDITHIDYELYAFHPLQPEYFVGNCIYCGVKVGQIWKSYSATSIEDRTEVSCKKCEPRRFDPRGLR
jgi:hypothetical protein